MAPNMNAHSVDNYFIGKGIVTFKPTGETVAYDVGNVPEFELTPASETLDHFSSREGVRKKDKSVVLEQSAELRMVMEEATARNLAMLLQGDVDNTDPMRPIIKLMSRAQVEGEIRFYATNDIGPRWDIVLPNVSFLPSGSLNPISDEWGNMEVTGQVLADESAGNFGTMQLRTPPDLPTNISVPTISGTAQEDEVLTAAPGTWLGSPAFTYAWKADGTPIVGATASTYTLVTADVGKAITVTVTGTNDDGTSSATSEATADVIAAA